MGRLGPMELAVIVGIVVLFFGPSQIPRIGKSLGESIREFRKIGKELETRDE